MSAAIQKAIRAALKWPKLLIAGLSALAAGLAKDRWFSGINKFLDETFGAATTKLLSDFLASPYAVPVTIFVIIFGGVFAHAYITGDRPKKANVVDERGSGIPLGAGLGASPPLTTDQMQFRVSLKQFALTYPAQLYDAIGRVRAVLIRKIKQNGDRDYSYALHHAMHFAWSSGNRHLERIKELASAELERIDIEALQHALRVFFDDYVWEQRLIANLNVLVKVNLDPLPETQKWLSTDKECWAELGKQKVWSEAAKLGEITEERMASNAANWTMPFKVNF